MSSVEDLFEESTPTGFAAVTCVENAWDLGNTIGGAGGDPSRLHFTDVCESGEGAYDCGRALAALEQQNEEADRVLRLSRQVLRETSESASWKRAADSTWRTWAWVGEDVASAARR